MKNIGMQLITVALENGQQGVFIGVPLVTGESLGEDEQVSEIWFSDIQQIPAQTSVANLLRLVAAQICRSEARLQ